MKRVSVIGAGFSSLSAACYLAKHGFKVEIFEKNSTIGGRARQYKEAGFIFDIGPTWYWMPDIFEKFFSDFGKNPSDYYKLEKLDPELFKYMPFDPPNSKENTRKRIERLIQKQNQTPRTDFDVAITLKSKQDANALD